MHHKFGAKSQRRKKLKREILCITNLEHYVCACVYACLCLRVNEITMKRTKILTSNFAVCYLDAPLILQIRAYVYCRYAAVLPYFNECEQIRNQDQCEDFKSFRKYYILMHKIASNERS